jgi:hypothetical protein
MAQFSDRMVAEVVQVFWAAMARGEFITAAAAEVGTYREKGMRCSQLGSCSGSFSKSPRDFSP